jgi:heptosyltransferase-1
VVVGNPDLDDVIVWPRQAWKRELAGPGAPARHARRALGLARALRSRRFDVAVDFQGLLRSALLVYASGAPHRIATAGTREGSDRFYTIRLPRTGDLSSRQRCLDLLQPLGIRSTDRRMVVAVTDADRAAAARLLAEVGVPAGAPYACLCPATTWANKHWSESGWAAVARGLAGRGVTPVFLGAGGDLPLIERINGLWAGEDGWRIEDEKAVGSVRSADQRPQSGSETPAVLAGKTTLKQAAALLEGAAVSAAVDTGLLHIGVAVGARMVALCGPSYWPGFQDYASERVRIARKPFDCSPCLRHPTCHHTPEMEAYACMLALTPAEILAEMDAVRTIGGSESLLLGTIASPGRAEDHDGLAA